MNHAAIGTLIVVGMCALAGCAADVRELRPHAGATDSAVPALDPAKSRVWICCKRGVPLSISTPTASDWKFTPDPHGDADASCLCAYFDSYPGSIEIEGQFVGPRILNERREPTFLAKVARLRLDLTPGSVHFVLAGELLSMQGGAFDLAETSEERGRLCMRDGGFVGRIGEDPASLALWPHYGD